MAKLFQKGRIKFVDNFQALVSGNPFLKYDQIYRVQQFMMNKILIIDFLLAFL